MHLSNPPAKPRPFLSPTLAILVGILAVSTGSILVRNAQEYAPSIVIAAYRLVLATLFLTPVALLRYREELGALRRPDLLLATLSGFFLSLHFATWIASLSHTSVAASVLLVNTAPLFAIVMSRVFLREKPPLAVQVAEQVLAKTYTPDDQKKAVELTIRSIERVH